jgi:hypothetical protein
MIAMKRSRHTTYQLTSAAPYIIPVSSNSFFEFCEKYQATVSSVSEMEPLKRLYNKMKILINMDEIDVNQHRFGKSNDINPVQQAKFNVFMRNLYKTNLIQIEYQDVADLSIYPATALLA